MQILSKWTATKLRTYDAIVLTIASMCCLGCSSDEVAQRPIAHGPKSVNSDSVSKVVAKGMQVAGANTSPSVPDAVLPEFPDDVNFFKLPQPITVRNEVAVNVSEKQKSIRLLGFVNPNPTDTTQKLALLKIGDRLVNLREGEKFEEIELLTIEDRTVTLQQQRDRWSLAMMDQSVVNQAVAMPKPRGRRQSPAGTINNPVVSDFRPTPIAEPWMPKAPVLPGVGEKFDPLMPPIEPPTPELPNTRDLPGI